MGIYHRADEGWFLETSNMCSVCENNIAALLKVVRNFANFGSFKVMFRIFQSSHFDEFRLLYSMIYVVVVI